MLWVELAIAALVLGSVALLAGGRGGGLPRAWADRPDPLPQPPWDASSMERIRFGVGFRGYRMDQVDEALDRIAVELAVRDARIAALEARDTDPPDEPDEAAANPGLGDSSAP